MFVGMVLLIGSVIGLVALLLLFLSGSLIGSSYGVKYNADAQAAATGGAEDALLRLTRGSITSFPASYSLPINNVTTQVNVANNTPSAGFYTVTSTATASFHTKVLRVVISTAPNGQISVVSWTQVQ